MTDGNNYCTQLKDSCVALRLNVPDFITNKVLEKIQLIQERMTVHVPESISYTRSIDQNKFLPLSQLTSLKSRGWNIKMMNVLEISTDTEVIMALITNVGCMKTKSGAIERRNGNNSIRHKAIKK